MEFGKLKCRVCLKLREHLREIGDAHLNINTTAFNFNTKITLTEAFHQMTNILVSPENAARLICDICCRKLVEAVEFRKCAEHADVEIRRLVEANLWCVEDIKEEETLFDEVAASPVTESDCKAELEVVELKLELHVERKRETRLVVDEIDQNAIFNISSKRYKRFGKREDKKYVCDTCGEEASTKSKIVSHIRKTHLRGYGRKCTPKLDGWVKKQLKHGKKLICDFCQAEFRSLILITKHLKKIHMCK